MKDQTAAAAKPTEAVPRPTISEPRPTMAVPRPSVAEPISVLFFGPFQTDDRVQRKLQEWTPAFRKIFGREVEVFLGDPRFYDSDRVNPAGYWLRPEAYSVAQMAKNLRKSMLNGVVELARKISFTGPAVVVALGQAAVVGAAFSLPLVIETA